MTHDREGHKERKGSSGLVFAACFFTGMGISIATGTMPVGIFIGMGAGFAAMAIVRFKLGEW